jgi:hypothetical protein
MKTRLGMHKFDPVPLPELSFVFLGPSGITREQPTPLHPHPPEAIIPNEQEQ